MSSDVNMQKREKIFLYTYGFEQAIAGAIKLRLSSNFILYYNKTIQILLHGIILLASGCNNKW